MTKIVNLQTTNFKRQHKWYLHAFKYQWTISIHHNNHSINVTVNSITIFRINDSRKKEIIKTVNYCHL